VDNRPLAAFNRAMVRVDRCLGLENPERHGRDGEEVDGDEISQMIIEEYSPTRTRWLRVAGHVLGDRRLG
jgi:hypothetical protein